MSTAAASHRPTNAEHCSACRRDGWILPFVIGGRGNLSPTAKMVVRTNQSLPLGGEGGAKRRMRCPYRCSHYLTASHKQTITHQICRDRRPRLSASLFALSHGVEGCSHLPMPPSEREGDHGRVPESECNELLGFVRVVEGACVTKNLSYPCRCALSLSRSATAPSRREPLRKSAAVMFGSCRSFANGGSKPPPYKR